MFGLFRRKSSLDEYGRSPLHYAAAHNDAAAVMKLIKAREDVNLADKAGWTPLHFAAQANAAAIVQSLLSAGAAVDPRNSHGNTPLMIATGQSKGKGDCIQALRKAGADPFAVNKSGVSPVAFARMVANFDLAQFYADLPETK